MVHAGKHWNESGMLEKKRVKETIATTVKIQKASEISGNADFCDNFHHPSSLWENTCSTLWIKAQN